MKKDNTTGKERWDLQIVQIRMTQKTVPNKKLYKRKTKHNKGYGNEITHW